MREKTQESTCTKKRLGVICVVAFLIILFLVVVYFYAIHPVLTTFVLYPKADTSLTLYTHEEYLTFEDGAFFYDFMSSVSFDEYGEPTSFFHLDRKIQDNPFYGKMPDLFAVDVQYNEEQYNKAKEELGNTWKYNTVEDYQGDVLYIYSDTTRIYCVGFSDTDYVIRFMMATEMENNNEFISLISRTIYWDS